VPPAAPPQLVACGSLDFYRITENALQVFEVSPQIPPPHIRGSRVAKQSLRLDVSEPNTVSVAGRRVVVTANGDAFEFRLGETSLRALGPRASEVPPEAAAPPEPVPGVVIDVSSEGPRLGVLSLEAEGQFYRPMVTVFEHGKQRGRVELGPSPALTGQPELDLCLLPGRPWVVVGGRYWLQLLDWTTSRLLAEW
jgi:hypothetical protein